MIGYGRGRNAMKEGEDFGKKLQESAEYHKEQQELKRRAQLAEEEAKKRRLLAWEMRMAKLKSLADNVINPILLVVDNTLAGGKAEIENYTFDDPSHVSNAEPELLRIAVWNRSEKYTGRRIYDVDIYKYECNGIGLTLNEEGKVGLVLGDPDRYRCDRYGTGGNDADKNRRKFIVEASENINEKGWRQRIEEHIAEAVKLNLQYHSWSN